MKIIYDPVHSQFILEDYASFRYTVARSDLIAYVYAELEANVVISSVLKDIAETEVVKNTWVPHQEPIPMLGYLIVLAAHWLDLRNHGEAKCGEVNDCKAGRYVKVWCSLKRDHANAEHIAYQHHAYHKEVAWRWPAQEPSERAFELNGSGFLLQRNGK